MAQKKKTYTTGFGAPVNNDQNSKTAGSRGPVLMQDVQSLSWRRCPKRIVPKQPKGRDCTDNNAFREMMVDYTSVKR